MPFFQPIFKPATGVNKALSGVLPAVIIAVAIGFIISKSLNLAILIPGVLATIYIAFVCITNTEAGLYIIMAYSFFISFIDRLFFNDAIPEGVPADLLVLITFGGLALRHNKLSDLFSDFTKNTVIVLFLILYIYTALQLFNPSGNFLTGWFQAVRKVVSTFLILFICYHVFADKNAIKRFIKYLFILASVVAIYACIQEVHGFFSFEMNWLSADEKRFRMTFVNGGARRMSTFPDALSLSIVMAMCTAFFTGYVTGVKKLSQKIIITVGILFMVMAMSFSLTRTANVMLVGGIIVFLLVTFNKPLSRFAAFAGLFAFLFVLYVPFGHVHMYQFRQTFKGATKDASYIVREVNRKRIQPYIYSHPIGGGLNTTGHEGRKNNPSHPLAGFPPDSGYLKKALELGWIGFALLLFLYFVILKTTIRGYFISTSPQRKVLYASCAGAFFALYMGDFAQEAIGQITDVVVYFPLIAIVLRLRKIESESQKIPV
jgi:putative inorganic carbon (hco3(-)) transporter